VPYKKVRETNNISVKKRVKNKIKKADND